MTDVFFLVFFVVCIILMVGVVIYGALEGDMKKYASPFDAAGNLCGYKYEEVKKYYVYQEQSGGCVIEDMNQEGAAE